MVRTQLSAAQRTLRSRLTKLFHEEPLMRGTLTMRSVVCGKKGCRCTQGQKHLALFLSSSLQGKTRQIFIPADMEDDVRRWVDNYHEVRDLLEAISELALENVHQRKRRASPSMAKAKNKKHVAQAACQDGQVQV